jgi:putative ATP-dependent endonuclease of the OLD family
MKLTQVEIKNYRSITHDYSTNESFVLDLSDGMNAIVGPNNVGKSNILRALSFALDPESPFDRSQDMPKTWDSWSKPVITLTFEVRNVGREKTLLKYVDDYERKAKGAGDKARTYAQEGVIKVRTAIEGSEDSTGVRRQHFVARGAGARMVAEDDPIAVRALSQFHKCFQYVLVRSGESLEDLLEGNFREILRTVIREDLRDEYEDAESARARYLGELGDRLLAPLTARAASELSDLFSDVTAVQLNPDIRTLDEALALMQVDVVDCVATDLASKGTGVRGGLIVAMLRHMAEASRRSMIFAIEEPESFLHPAAQGRLCEDLEQLAGRPDVTLLVTTHSPHIVSRAESSTITAIDKNMTGETVLVGAGTGAGPDRGRLLSGLYDGSLLLDLLDREAEFKPGADTAVVVEGWTDLRYIEIALNAAGRQDLLDRIHISFPSVGSARHGGASLAIVEALTLKSAFPGAVVALFDSDAEGRKCFDMLKEIGSKTKQWRKMRTLFQYGDAFDPSAPSAYEAEDLWPNGLLESFIRQDEDARLSSKAKRPKSVGGWHYDLAAQAKPDFVEFLESQATASHVSKWVDLIDTILTKSAST